MNNVNRRSADCLLNEIGNTIRIVVEETEDTGTNAVTGRHCRFRALRLVMEGPTSLSENTITRKEAEVLLDCLIQVLRPDE